MSFVLQGLLYSRCKFELEVLNWQLSVLGVLSSSHSAMCY